MAVTEQTLYENFQIYRLDNRNKFVEVLNRAFEINKVILNFVEYDTNKEVGNRITQQVTVYMDFPKFRVFAHDMLSGRFAQMAAKKVNPIFQDLSGTSVERLKAKNQAREDGMAESRKLMLTPASKGFFLTASSGPGEETETGLIKPAGKPEKEVSILITPEQAKELVLTTLASIDHYLTAKETVRLFEEIRKSRQPKGKTA